MDTEIIAHLAERLLAAGADVDFDAFGIDPDDPDDVWDSVSVALPSILDAMGVTDKTTRRDMHIQVRDEFMRRF